MNLSRRLTPAVLALSAALIAALGYTAFAAPRMAPPPVAIATIDIIRVFDKLNERSDWLVQLTALNKRIQDELVARQKALEEMNKSAETVTGPEKSALRDKLAMAKLQLDQWANLKQAEIDREQGLMWASIYHNIRVESDKLAQAEGYDLVLVNDGVSELTLDPAARVPQAQQAQEQIMRRRVMYANKSIDVTDKLILRMNNARTTGSGSANPAPATPATPPAKPPSGTP